MTTIVTEADIPQILATIRKRESGGNYKAHAKKGTAAGAYQFITGTWQSNARAAGVDIRQYPTADSAPADVQDKVAAANVRNILQANGWDAEAVPAAWYLGHVPAAGSAEWDNVPAPEYGNTATPRQYVSGWMKTFNGTTGTTAPSTGTPSPGDQAVQNLTEAQIEEAAAQYGYAAVFLKDPEIGPILIKAAKLGYTPARLENELMGTSWYRNYSAATRQWRMLAEKDPQTANAQLAQRQADISDQASKLGLQLDDQKLKTLAYQSLGFGWSPTQLTDALTSELKYSPEAATHGQIGTGTAAVKALAAKYYLTISDETAFNYAKQITGGQLDMGGVEATFRSQAKGKFPTIADQIEAGVTPEDYFDPYRQTIAKELDLPVSAVDLANDPRYQPVLSMADGKTLRPMTISETTKWARNQPQWDATKGGLDLASQFGEQLTKLFGATA